MAIDKKISELDPLHAADLSAGDDLIAIVDTSSNETKKITPSNLMSGRVSSETITHIVKLTQAEYDALSTPDLDALYIIA